MNLGTVIEKYFKRNICFVFFMTFKTRYNTTGVHYNFIFLNFPQQLVQRLKKDALYTMNCILELFSTHVIMTITNNFPEIILYFKSIKTVIVKQYKFTTKFIIPVIQSNNNTFYQLYVYFMISRGNNQFQWDVVFYERGKGKHINSMKYRNSTTGTTNEQYFF